MRHDSSCTGRSPQNPGRSLVALIAVFLLPTSAMADGLAVDFTGGSGGFVGPPPSTVGFEFTVSSPITITGLGFWDEGSDGLAVSHEVGLWNADGSTLLTSTTVSNADFPEPSSSPDGVWLLRSVAPLDLQPGNYVVGTLVSDSDLTRTDFFLGQSMSVTTAPEVSYVETRFMNTPVFAYPDQSFAPFHIFGANVVFTETTNVPSVPGLTAIGAAVLISILGSLGAARLRAPGKATF